MTLPSREFLVRQACLNAMTPCLDMGYLANLIFLADRGSVDLSYFAERTRNEFRKLVLKFDSAEVA